MMRRRQKFESIISYSIFLILQSVVKPINKYLEKDSHPQIRGYLSSLPDPAYGVVYGHALWPTRAPPTSGYYHGRGGFAFVFFFFACHLHKWECFIFIRDQRVLSKKAEALRRPRTPNAEERRQRQLDTWHNCHDFIVICYCCLAMSRTMSHLWVK